MKPYYYIVEVVSVKEIIEYLGCKFIRYNIETKEVTEYE